MDIRRQQPLVELKNRPDWRIGTSLRARSNRPPQPVRATRALPLRVDVAVLALVRILRAVRDAIVSYDNKSKYWLANIPISRS